MNTKEEISESFLYGYNSGLKKQAKSPVFISPVGKGPYMGIVGLPSFYEKPLAFKPGYKGIGLPPPNILNKILSSGKGKGKLAVLSVLGALGLLGTGTGIVAKSFSNVKKDRDDKRITNMIAGALLGGTGGLALKYMSQDPTDKKEKEKNLGKKMDSWTKYMLLGALAGGGAGLGAHYMSPR